MYIKIYTLLFHLFILYICTRDSYKMFDFQTEVQRFNESQICQTYLH